MFVSVAVAIPRYIIVNELGMVDSFWAHVIPLLAMPVGLYLVKQFIDDLPDSMIEAARIDGASDYRYPAPHCRSQYHSGIGNGGHSCVPGILEQRGSFELLYQQ